MATRTVKARVELDGEKQYKQAISELNKGNQVLASEMRKLQAEYKGNTESTEFLTKKGELLERQLLQQKDKVQTLRDALAEAAQKYGESSAETQEYQIKLNNAEAALFGFEHAIVENNAAMQGENETLQGLGDTVGDLASKLGIHLPDGAKEALNGMQGLSTGTVAAMGAAVAGVAALVQGVKALHETTLEKAAEADEILTESMKTGLGTKTIQELKYAENLIDVSYSTITGTLTKLTKNMDAARDGNEKLAENFKKLGVSIVDTSGNLRSSESVFYDLIDALGQVENGTERDAISMELFGRSAQELNPLILQGSDALRELAAEAEATGYVLDESQITKLGEVDDAYQRMQLQVEATKKELAASFAPVSIAAMQAFTDVMKLAGDAVHGLADAGRALHNSLLATELRTMAEQLAKILGLKKEVFETNENGTFAQGGNWLNPETGLWEGNFYASLGPMDDYFYDKETGRIWNHTRRAWVDDYRAEIYGYNAGGTPNWRGGLTWVGEAGPELVRLPSGSEVMSAQESRRAAGTTIFNITIPAKDIREFNDIVRIAQDAPIQERMGEA